ncbi:polysaccharide deacetylase family protein [Clostridium saudiense]|nr:polysaccharide deacetylase family protein [Clostridium saudiense]
MFRKRKIIIAILLIFGTMITSIIGSKSILVNGSLDKKPIFRVNTENKQIALTFDVNWAENEYIYDILDVLNKYNVKATFFVMGKWVNYPEGNKEKLIKINEMGHEIGNHSYVHPSFSKIDESRMLEELTKTDDIIYEAIGVKPTLFRFPSGDYNDKALQFVLEKGYKCIQWDCDSVDWKESGEEVEYERIMKKVTSGSIMLFHNNAKYTPSNLDKIISKLKEDGYEFVTVGQLTECDEYYIDENGEQHKK